MTKQQFYFVRQAGLHHWIGAEAFSDTRHSRAPALGCALFKASVYPVSRTDSAGEGDRRWTK